MNVGPFKMYFVKINKILFIHSISKPNAKSNKVKEIKFSTRNLTFLYCDANAHDF